jgi:hypothetical protein
MEMAYTNKTKKSNMKILYISRASAENRIGFFFMKQPLLKAPQPKMAIKLETQNNLFKIKPPTKQSTYC